MASGPASTTAAQLAQLPIGGWRVAGHVSAASRLTGLDRHDFAFCQQQQHLTITARDSSAMSDSDDPVVIPESPPTRLSRSSRAASRSTAPKHASSDDDIVALDAPPVTPAQSAPRPTRPRSRKKRLSGDEDVVFVRESPRAKSSLAARFTYAGGAAPVSRSRARPGAATAVARTAPAGPVRSLSSTSAGPSVFGAPVASVTNALLPPRDDPAPPVPEWLGRTSVLLRLRDCPVCRRTFKKAEAGPARWVSCLLGSRS